MAATKTYVSNASETTLTAALGVGVGTISVTSTTGFPAVPFYAVLEPSLDAKREIVLVTAKTATTFTATRAQDGTTDVAHDAGVSIKVLPVAAHINDLHDRVDLAYVAGGTDIPITDGGTGASTAAAARTNLGLGTIATQAASAVAITGGSVTGITDLAIADGGTGASTAAAAIAALGGLPTAGGTMSGELNLADQLLTRPVLKDYGEEVVANATATGAVTLDLTGGNVRNVTLTGNTTFTFSNPTASGDACSFTLILRQDGTGSRTVTWPASVDWAGGVAPTISTTANAVDIFTFLTVDGGTIWFGFLGGKAFA